MGNIDIGFDLINAAKDEVGGLDISSTTSYKAFPPGEKCAKIIESVKQQVCVRSRCFTALKLTQPVPTKGAST